MSRSSVRPWMKVITATIIAAAFSAYSGLPVTFFDIMMIVMSATILCITFMMLRSSNQLARDETQPLSPLTLLGLLTGLLLMTLLSIAILSITWNEPLVLNTGSRGDIHGYTRDHWKCLFQSLGRIRVQGMIFN